MRGLSLVPALVALVVITMSAVIVVVTVSIMIPAVIVFNTATVSFPVTHIVSLAIVVRCDPASSLVRWSGPIAHMPLVMLSHWIPITVHPHAFRFRLCGENHGHSRWWWRPNYDANRNLCVNCRSRD
jgi:hypothetical protein